MKNETALATVVAGASVFSGILLGLELSKILEVACLFGALWCAGAAGAFLERLKK